MASEIPRLGLPGPDRILELYSLALSQGGSGLSEAMAEAVKDLPTLTEPQIISLGHKDSVCAICFNTFLAILAEQEMAEAMDSPTHAVEELGVTRLSQEWQCGHLFCRKDIVKWIQEGKKTCPTCRRPIAKPGTDEREAEVPAEQVQNIIDSYLEMATRTTPARPASNEREHEFSGMYS
ncbi:RING-type domain-containing protein [Pleurotus pulmonarius]